MSKPPRDMSLKRKVEEAFNGDAEELVDSSLLETTGKRRHEALIDDSDEDDDSESYFQEKKNKPGPSGLQTKAKRVSSQTMNIKPDMPDFATPDECLFGSIVANRLKRLAEDQKIYAEKIISDALHYAMLNRLSSASNVTL